MSWLFIVWLVLAAGAMAQALLLTLQTYEHRRFVRAGCEMPAPRL